jgi:DNA polymerase V
MAGMRGDLVDRAHKIRSRILQWVGIPCGIGIGTTKTLAKLANHVAKTAERKPGSYPEKLSQVCDLASLSPGEFQSVLAATEVNEVWGVGPRISKQLKAEGINTVFDLARLDAALVRSRWSVMLERTVRELQGTPCIGFEDNPPAKQQIACTRSFGQPVTQLHQLSEAVTEFASRAAEKLRKQGSLAGKVLVYIRTSPFRKEQQCSKSMVTPFQRPTANTAHIVAAALDGLRKIYSPGFMFAKAGIMLMELQSDLVHQCELDLEDFDRRDCGNLMVAMDGLNQRYGKGSVHMASAGLAGKNRVWSMKQERRTPGYTTQWEDMPVARA